MAALGAANRAGSDAKITGSALTHMVPPAESFGAAVAFDVPKQNGSTVYMAEPINPMSFGTAKGFILGPWAI